MIDYLFFIGIGLLLFSVFRVLRLAGYRIQLIHRFYPMLIALELTLWMTFLFWLIHYLFQSKAYYNNLILVLVITSVILLVWFYIKDVIAGFLFRIKHNPGVGQILQSKEASGVIKIMTPSQILVEEEGRNIVRIPYSAILGKALSLDNKDTHSASEVVLRLEFSNKLNYTEIERKAKVNLLQSPWVVPGKPIHVTFLSAPENGIEVSLHLVDKTYAEVARLKLKNLLDSKS